MLEITKIRKRIILVLLLIYLANFFFGATTRYFYGLHKEKVWLLALTGICMGLSSTSMGLGAFLAGFTRNPKIERIDGVLIGVYSKVIGVISFLMGLIVLYQGVTMFLSSVGT